MFGNKKGIILKHIQTIMNKSDESDEDEPLDLSLVHMHLGKDEEIEINLETTILTEHLAAKCFEPGTRVIIPMTNSQTCNSLSDYYNKSFGGKSPRKSNFFELPARNFASILLDPSKDASEQDRRPKKKRPDVFKKIDELDHRSGPLNLLKQSLGKTIKVKVRRRRKAPYISRVIDFKGTLILFDAHLNLLMEDVTESFTYELDNQLLVRAREKKSFFLRGDNIILISMNT